MGTCGSSLCTTIGRGISRTMNGTFGFRTDGFVVAVVVVVVAVVVFAVVVVVVAGVAGVVVGVVNVDVFGYVYFY